MESNAGWRTITGVSGGHRIVQVSWYSVKRFTLIGRAFSCGRPETRVSRVVRHKPITTTVVQLTSRCSGRTHQSNKIRFDRKLFEALLSISPSSRPVGMAWAPSRGLSVSKAAPKNPGLILAEHAGGLSTGELRPNCLT